MAIALTFDDGPDPVWTPAVLRALAAADARATFFVIAPRAARCPELVERCLAEGHGVALHCHAHVRHSQRDAAWLRADTTRALDELATVGVQPQLWRAPWGDIAPFTSEVAAEHALTLVGWNSDTHDWRGDRARDMYAAIAGDLVDGAVVLAHDALGPGALRENCEETVELIGRIAEHAHARGIGLEALAAVAA